jgi:hypothetical protein
MLFDLGRANHKECHCREFGVAFSHTLDPERTLACPTKLFLMAACSGLSNRQRSGERNLMAPNVARYEEWLGGVELEAPREALYVNTAPIVLEADIYQHVRSAVLA